MREISSHFILPKQSILSRWAEALPVFLSSPSLSKQKEVSPLNRVSIDSHWTLSGKAVLSSCFFHFLFCLFLLYGPSNALFTNHRISADRRIPSHEQIVYYDLRTTHMERLLPKLSSRAREGKARREDHSHQTSMRGRDAFHPRLTMAMHPPKTDSIHQTILEPTAPPELKITKDLKLPNIVIESVSPPRPHLLLSLQKPLSPKPHHSAVRTPGIAQEASWEKEPFHSELPIMTPAPALPVPTMDMPHPKSEPAGPSEKTDAELGSQSAAPPPDLIAVSTDPGTLQAMLAVPLGNRYGDFSVSPTGGHPTVPGVNATGEGPSGSIGTGHRGSGAGAGGITKGDGNMAGGAFPLSVSGGAAKPSGAVSTDAGNRMLAGTVNAGQIFPVLVPLQVRGLNIQVFSGPTGGGGLAVYGVLPCGKIYTISLAMPKKNWILQYCTRTSDNPAQAENTTNHLLHLDRGLVAPSPTSKFDFKRPATTSEPRSALIILRGEISEDGSVADVTVLKGTDPQVDTLAAAAFRRWKFQPALRSGKPVQVEVLVGVPVSMS